MIILVLSLRSYQYKSDDCKEDIFKPMIQYHTVLLSQPCKSIILGKRDAWVNKTNQNNYYYIDIQHLKSEKCSLFLSMVQRRIKRERKDVVRVVTLKAT